MKASVFTGIESLEMREMDVPSVEPGGILIKVMACGICGSDIRNYQSGLRDYIQEQIMGHEIAGVVEKVGENCENYKKGDRVAIAPDVSCGECYYCRKGLVNLCEKHKMLGTHWAGGFAQYVYLPEEIVKHGMVNRIPDTLTYDAATLAEPLSSVMAAQEKADIQMGETVVILGDGPIGCMHLEIARARGAGKIIMSGLSRLSFAREFAPDVLVDSSKEDIVKTVLRETEGRGADVVITALPVALAQTQAVLMVRKRGRVVLFGGLPAAKPDTILDGNKIHYNEIIVMGTFSYTLEHNRRAIDAINSKKISVDQYLTDEVTLEGIPAGIEAAKSGRAVKVVVKPWKNEG